MPLRINTPAPQFNLPDQDGANHALADYKGSWVLLYFYPKDDTPGCTSEACSFRDSWQECSELGLIVLGISADSVDSHHAFATKYNLPFTLLSDPEKTVLNQYDAWGEKSMFGKKYMGVLRSSVLISPKGTIAKVYQKIRVNSHAQDVLKDLKNHFFLSK